MPVVTRRDLNERFAANLRSAVANVPSIAALCEGSGINRQQFNKYLVGASTPSVSIAYRIAEALDVPLDSLLREQGPLPTSKAGFSELVEIVSASSTDWVVPGIYIEYSLSSVLPDTLVKSMSSIKRSGSGWRFKRKQPVAVASTNRRDFWTYDGLCAHTSGGFFINYINTTLSENFGSMYLRRYSPATDDLIGMKLGVAATSTPTQFSSGVFLRKLSSDANLTANFRRCGSIKLSSMEENECQAFEVLRSHSTFRNDVFRMQ